MVRDQQDVTGCLEAEPPKVRFERHMRSPSAAAGNAALWDYVKHMMWCRPGLLAGTRE